MSRKTTATSLKPPISGKKNNNTPNVLAVSRTNYSVEEPMPLLVLGPPGTVVAVPSSGSGRTDSSQDLGRSIASFRPDSLRSATNKSDRRFDVDVKTSCKIGQMYGHSFIAEEGQQWYSIEDGGRISFVSWNLLSNNRRGRRCTVHGKFIDGSSVSSLYVDSISFDL